MGKSETSGEVWGGGRNLETRRKKEGGKGREVVVVVVVSQTVRKRVNGGG